MTTQEKQILIDTYKDYIKSAREKQDTKDEVFFVTCAFAVGVLCARLEIELPTPEQIK